MAARGMLLPHRPAACAGMRPTAVGLGQLLLSQKGKPGAPESPFGALHGCFRFPQKIPAAPITLRTLPSPRTPRGPPRPRWPNLWPCRAPTWRLGQDDDVAGEPNVAGGPALQRDGEAVEVVQHLHDGGEAQVLDAALAPLRQRQPQVLRGGARTRYPATGSLAGGDDGGTQGCLGWRGGGQTALASCAASPARGARPADGFFPPLGVGMRTPASAGAGRGQGERLLGWDGTGLAPTHLCAAPEGSPV